MLRLTEEILLSNLSDEAPMWEFDKTARRILGINIWPEPVESTPDPLVEEYVLRSMHELVSLDLAHPMTASQAAATGEWSFSDWKTTADETVERVRHEWRALPGTAYGSYFVSFESTPRGLAEGGAILGATRVASRVEPRLGRESETLFLTDAIAQIGELGAVSLSTFVRTAERILGVDTPLTDSCSYPIGPLVRMYVQRAVTELIQQDLATATVAGVELLGEASDIVATVDSAWNAVSDQSHFREASDDVVSFSLTPAGREHAKSLRVEFHARAR